MICTLAACMNIASPRCPVVPMPGEPKLSLPGCALASATNSFSVFASTFGCTTSSIGISATFEIGMNAVSASNGIFA